LDIATLIGLILGLAAIMTGILVGKGNPLSFWDAPAFFIVIGGGLMAAFVAFPIERIGRLVSVMFHTLRGPRAKPEELIPVLVGLARRARREGLLALEAEMPGIDNEFMRRGLQLVIDGADPESLRDILSTDIALMRERHASSRSMLEFMARVCPAFGLVGTLIGLVLMLRNLRNEPNQIGENMAVALVATFYGVVAANLIFVPMANKLSLRSEEELVAYRLTLEGIMSIQSGENPGMVAEKLRTYLPPGRRDLVSADMPTTEG